ncbi:MAG: RDD family protein [Bacteroidota bacterium]
MKIKLEYILRRSLAYFIDVSIIYVVLMLVFQWLIMLPIRTHFGMDENWFRNGWNVQFYVWLTISLPTWLYFIGSEASNRKATFGKRILKLQVLDSETKSKISKTKSIKRTALKLLPWELIHIGLNLPTPVWFEETPNFRYLVLLGSILFVVYFIMAFVYQRTLYDKLLNTLVSN